MAAAVAAAAAAPPSPFPPQPPQPPRQRRMLRRIPATIGRSEYAFAVGPPMVTTGSGIAGDTGDNRIFSRIGSPRPSFPGGFVLPSPPPLRSFLAPDAHPGVSGWISASPWCPPWLRDPMASSPAEQMQEEPEQLWRSARRRNRAAMLDGDVDEDIATRDRARVLQGSRESLEDR
ncbi:hypothetical protein HK405_015270, partial [Cladochytrium tenue]